MDEHGGSGHVADDEKLAHFQSLTGVEDTATSARILESHGWDLAAAVSAAMNGEHQQQQHYDEYPQQNQQQSNRVGLAQLGSGSEAAGFDRRHLPYPGSTRSNSMGSTAAAMNFNDGNPHLVWKLITLPFSVIRGGLNVVSGAMGLGAWVAGSMLSYSLGALGFVPPRLGDGRTGRSPSQAVDFVRRFEAEYGEQHPEFQLMSFMEALKKAADEFKFLFVYLHSPEHMDTPGFCQGTLCSDLVREFVNHNFVAWGADVRSPEGFQMFNSLKASTFPFCAVVMAAPGQRIALLQQVAGPRTPAELVSLLQRVLDEHGAALVAARVEEEERRRNRQLRDEQDAAYRAALQADQERENRRREEAERQAREAEAAERERLEKEAAAERAATEAAEKQAALEELRRAKALSLGAEPEKGPDVTQVLFRFPTGERKERRFHCSSHVQAVYDYVDSLGCMEGDYSLVSNFPRTVYSKDKLRLTLKETGLHPHASLFVQVE